MSKILKPVGFLLALAACGLAAASPLGHGMESREGLMRIELCAKADQKVEKIHLWTDDARLRESLSKASSQGCFERLGRAGDVGYAQLGVVLLNARAGTYKSIVDGHPAGIALIGLTTPSDIVKKPELTRRVGRVSASFYSPTGHKTVHSVVYADGARDLIRRVGITARIQPGTLVEVTREQIDADTYWLAITQEIL